MKGLSKDPFNLIIAGVGGQGNLRLADIIGQALLKGGYLVAIGDTLGGAQRGGSVASQIRISSETRYGPYIPEGQADIILGMEPIETLRVLTKYGSPATAVITSTRPISSVDMFGKRANYPAVDVILDSIRELAGKVWIIDAMSEALSMGKPVFANMILIGTLVGTDLLPLQIESIEEQLRLSSGAEAGENLTAVKKGLAMIAK